MIKSARTVNISSGNADVAYNSPKEIKYCCVYALVIQELVKFGGHVDRPDVVTLSLIEEVKLWHTLKRDE